MPRPDNGYRDASRADNAFPGPDCKTLRPTTGRLARLAPGRSALPSPEGLRTCPGLTEETTSPAGLPQEAPPGRSGKKSKANETQPMESNSEGTTLQEKGPQPQYVATPLTHGASHGECGTVRAHPTETTEAQIFVRQIGPSFRTHINQSRGRSCHADPAAFDGPFVHERDGSRARRDAAGHVPCRAARRQTGINRGIRKKQ